MDVRSIFWAFVFTLMLSSCGQSSKLNQATVSLSKAACTGAAAVKSKVIVEWENGQITFENISDIEKFKDDFVKPQISLIKRVQYDQKIQLYPQQMHSSALPPGGISDDWGQQIIKLNKMTEKAASGQKIIVGVVDTYVDITHPQLKNQIAINTAEIPNNGIDDDGNGVIDDYYGADFSMPSNLPPLDHGTHVSGIIAADINFGSIQGIAPGAKIVPAQFLGNDQQGNLSDAIKALEYAASRGARIINASWGGPGCSMSLATEFNNLQQKGILMIVAAGNDGADLEIHPTYPAAFTLDNQITVAASNPSDFMAEFSNSSFNLVNIAAPGVSIRSTIPNNSTAFMDGTSMAAPFVTGAAALLWGLRPDATAQQIKTALLSSVDVFQNHEFRVSTQGRLNVYEAYLKLKAALP